ncbi:MAG: PilZ domain-containing protein [Hyphomicrobiales bacterium]
MGTPAQTAQVFLDRREAARIPVDHNALGLSSSQTKALDCNVLDLSVTGARVKIQDVDIIPQKFKLFIPEAGWLYSCEVVRRSGGEVGVRFTSREPFTPFSFDP